MRPLLGIVLLAASVAAVGAQPVAKPAVPLDAITGVLDLFKEYRVVALGEGPHGNEQGHRYRLSLIRDRRFPTLVNDIVVESGTARYQDVMDRFIRGEAVPHKELRRTWEDTTIPGAGLEKPIYEEFYTAVRDVNRTLPKDRQIRVLLGEPPIAWETIKRSSDIRPWWRQRDAHAVAVIKREVLAKNRRALVVYGDGHFQGRGFAPGSITVLLERDAGEKIFTISTSFADLARFQPDVTKWKIPSFARLKDTAIGTQFYARFYPLPPRPGWNTVLMQDQFDGIVYVGRTMTMSKMPRRLCDDPEYMKMRLARLALAPDQRAKPAEQLKRYCDSLEK